MPVLVLGKLTEETISMCNCLSKIYNNLHEDLTHVKMKCSWSPVCL